MFSLLLSPTTRNLYPLNIRGNYNQVESGADTFLNNLSRFIKGEQTRERPPDTIGSI
jgi:hypothetical protein